MPLLDLRTTQVTFFGWYCFLNILYSILHVCVHVCVSATMYMLRSDDNFQQSMYHMSPRDWTQVISLATSALPSEPPCWSFPSVFSVCMYAHLQTHMEATEQPQLAFLKNQAPCLNTLCH